MDRARLHRGQSGRRIADGQDGHVTRFQRKMLQGAQGSQIGRAAQGSDAELLPAQLVRGGDLPCGDELKKNLIFQRKSNDFWR